MNILALQDHADRVAMTFMEVQKHTMDDATFPVSVPESQSGKWKIVTRKVDEMEALLDSFSKVQQGVPEFVVSPGEYKVLVGPMGVMMSNTQLEYRTNAPIIEKAHGHVMIAGLGLGMILRPIAEKPEVKSITVLEKEPDVERMVADHYADLVASGKLRIRLANVFHWRPDRQFDFVYHDIWPDVGPKNLKAFEVLRKKYAPFAKEQHFWAEDLCLRMKQQEDELFNLLEERRARVHQKAAV